MIKIKKPFYSAGLKYGWSGQGVGVNLSALHGEGKIEITIGKDPQVLSIDKEEAKRLIKYYNSYFEARGTKLGVLTLSSFKS